MEEPNEGVNPEDENLEPNVPAGKEKNDQQGSEPVKNSGEEGKKPTADDLLRDSKRILVDKERFDDRNEKAKIYEAFAPVIDKIKDNPDLVEQLLETSKKGSLEERVAQMEREKVESKRLEIKDAVNDALSKYKDFDKDWPEIRDQVEMLAKRGLSFKEAIRRSYLSLHPEEAENQARLMAQENASDLGRFQSGGGYAPKPKDESGNTPKLNERERRVAQDLLGKDMGGGMVLFKSEEDYARILEKHKDYLRGAGFYDLP